MTLSAPIVHVAQTAGLYSQIAGVLAGFAFTGILIYLSPTDDRSRPGTARLSLATRGTVVVLISTLGALVLCAILYAVLAGGPDQSASASTGILINGLSFGLAILSMFYSIGLAALPHRHLDALLRVVRFMAGVIGPFVAMLLVASAGLDVCTLYPSACTSDAYYLPTHPFGFGALLAFVILVASAVTAKIARSDQADEPSQAPVSASVLVLGSAVLCIAASVVLGSQSQDYIVGRAALYVFEGVSFGILLSFALLVVVSCRPIRRDAPAAPPPRPATLEHSPTDRGRSSSE